MIVVDSSAFVELLLSTARGRAIGARIIAPDVSLHAPHLVDLEVLSTFRRHVQTGTIEPGRASAALDVYAAIRIERYAHDRHLQRIWSMRGNVTAYDAAYVALAEALDAPLLTCDARLAASAGHQARIELV